MLPSDIPKESLDRLARQYLARVGMRYVPFTLAAVCFLVMIAVVPSKTPGSQTAVAPGGAASAGGGSQAAGGSGSTSGASGGAVTGSGGAAAPAGTSGGSVATGSSAARSGSTAGASTGGSTGAGSSAAGAAPAAPTGAAGLTINGRHCGPGVRQVAWTVYSPMCVPAFHGNNGGATSYGVTGSTITVSFRISDSGEAGAVAAAAPSLNAQAQDLYLQDLSTYMKYFSTQFDLYGRHIVFKEFTGQGDWVQEYQDQDLAAAQADADTARKLGAFADISTTDVSTSPPYAQYLAEDHVLSVGGVAGSQHFYQTYAPYIYSAGPSLSNLDDWVPGVICQRMKGLPAIFAGDAADKLQKRVFGVIYPTNPDFQLVGKAIIAKLQACGAPIASTYQYAIDLSTMAQDSALAMAQMRSKGVTTVVCLCDTVVPRFLSQAADGQSYHPEWVFSGAADSLTQNYASDQFAHAIAPESTFVAETQSEAYHVYQLAAPGKKPASVYYYYAYESALLFYEALQNAGPDLTPATYERGFFTLPNSLPGGQLGPWSFGTNHFTSSSGAPIGWYNPSAVSNEDQTAGAWITCAGSDGAYHPWEPQSGYGPAGTQLHCFNQ